jgi:hypothetical protein
LAISGDVEGVVDPALAKGALKQENVTGLVLDLENAVFAHNELGATYL